MRSDIMLTVAEGSATPLTGYQQAPKKIGNSTMSATITALAVAVVGVIGTLLSPILAQRSTARASQVAAAIQRDIRVEERDADAQRIAFEERRSVYTSLNSLARTCRNQFKDYARHYEKTGIIAPEDVASAREAWISYQDQYDSSQMVLPDEVLTLASRLNALLSQGFRYVRELNEPGQGAPDTVVEFCNGPVLEAVTLMRQAMREDLGVSKPQPSSSIVPSSTE